jgi:8-oxo-dGTP pyrophosphatase MutT (NUDIX family)
MVGPEESPYEAAKRELKEETGMAASRLIALGSCTLMPSRFSNRLSWYVGLDVSAETASTSPELERLLLTPAELIRCENELGADQLLALGIIVLAHAKFPDMVPAVW